MATFDEFNLYLDSVKESGDRSRKTIYLIFILIFLVLFSIRNTIVPAWPNVLLKNMEENYLCHTTKGKNYINKKDNDYNRCDNLIKDYSEDLPLPPDIDKYEEDKTTSNDAAVNEQIRHYKRRVDYLTQLEVSTFAITVPLIGVNINSNDLWMLLVQDFQYFSLFFMQI